MKRRNVFNSPHLLKLKRKRRQLALGKLVIGGFSIAIIIGGLIYIARIPELNIAEVQAQGSHAADSAEVERRVNEILREYYFGLFPKSNVLIYPKGEIEDFLFREYKGFKIVTFELKQKGVLGINITEREGKYTWCGEQPPKSGEVEKCYFLDDTGYIFEEAPYFSGEVYFKFYGGKYGEHPAGNYYERQIFPFLLRFQKDLVKFSLNTAGMALEEGGDIAFFFSSPKIISESPKILVKRDSNFEEIAENLHTAVNTEPLKTQLKKNFAKLEYIDLRFGNKVYYKFDE